LGKSSGRLESGCGKPVGWRVRPHASASSDEQVGDADTLRRYRSLSLTRLKDWGKSAGYSNGDTVFEWRASHFDMGINAFVVRVKRKSAFGGKVRPDLFLDGTLPIVDPEKIPRCGSCVIVSRTGSPRAALRWVILVDGKTYLEAMNSRRPRASTRIGKNDRLHGLVVFARFDFS